MVIGTNAQAGEVRMLLVGTGVWKKSRLLPEDLEHAKEDPISLDSTGCLITEVVVPGFDWEDHKYLTNKGMKDLFSGVEGGDEYVEKLLDDVLDDN